MEYEFTQRLTISKLNQKAKKIKMYVLTPSAKEVAVAAFETQDHVTGPRLLHDQGVDLLLRYAVPVRGFSHADDLGRGLDDPQQLRGNESIVHDDVGPLQEVIASQGNQLGVPRSGADKIYGSK